MSSHFHAEGEEPLAGNTQVAIIRLLGVRQRDDTALAGAPPAWAVPGAQLQYSGAWTFVNPYDTMGPPAVYPAWMGVGFGPGGPTWLEYGTEMLVDFAGIPNQTIATGVAGGSGPYWIDPGTLALAAEGQLIDEDPITGERVSIERVGPGPAGEAVTVLSEMPGITGRAMYDVETGALVAVARTEDASGITTELTLDALP